MSLSQQSSRVYHVSEMQTKSCEIFEITGCTLKKILLISTSEGMLGHFIKKILPYNLHGTMAYYTPLYTSYICSETFKTV